MRWSAAAAQESIYKAKLIDWSLQISGRKVLFAELDALRVEKRLAEDRANNLATSERQGDMLERAASGRRRASIPNPSGDKAGRSQTIMAAKTSSQQNSAYGQLMTVNERHIQVF